MKQLLTIITELNIAITFFFLAYQLLYKRDSNFNNRRAFLLTGMLISFLVPFINIHFNLPVQALNSSVISLEGVLINAGGDPVSHGSIPFIELLILTYIAVSAFFLIRLFVSVVRVLYKAMISKATILEGKKVILNSDFHASSFFTYIFMDPCKTSDEDMRIILNHESYHVRLLHSFDRILAELLLSISWFNPAVWLLRKAIVVNHEYQADNRVIEQGTDQVSYQLTILNQYIGSASISNQFSNHIKNRINMLNKKYKKGSFWKSSVLLPISFVLFFFMACSNEGASDENTTKSATPAEEEIFYVVEEMPQWPGSDDMIMSVRNFIAKNLKYPEKAIEQGAEGKVFIHFLVTKTGDVVIPKPSQLPPEQADDGSENEVVVVAYRPLTEGQDMPEEEIVQLFKDESVRVLELMPDLIPGKQRGKAVNVIFTMPITFKLQ